jgi:hypothetical protein
VLTGDLVQACTRLHGAFDGNIASRHNPNLHTWQEDQYHLPPET